jgi:hypothetical protein
MLYALTEAATSAARNNTLSRIDENITARITVALPLRPCQLVYMSHRLRDDHLAARYLDSKPRAARTARQ